MKKTDEKTARVSCAGGRHSDRQRVVNRPDGSRVQVCELCREVVAVLQRAPKDSAA